MSSLIFFNDKSGTGTITEADIASAFPSARLVGINSDLRSELDGAADCDFIGVAGGDGTVRAVVATMVDALGESAPPLLVIPAGTRNHFAKDLGIRSLEDAVSASVTQKIDLGCVNDHLFVNNASIGIYPRIVVGREHRERRLPKGIAHAVATWEQLRHGSTLEIKFAGETLSSWLVFAGNGSYGSGLMDLTDRESLQTGMLDIRVARADHPFARTRILAALVFGRLVGSPLIEQRKSSDITLSVNRKTVQVALDGEVEEMTAPLNFRSVPSALTVLVPPAE